MTDTALAEPDHMPTLRFLFAADALSVRHALRFVRSALEGHGVPAATRDAAEQVLAEVFNNIVEHAYRDRADGMVDLTVDLGDDLVCHIGDSGRPFGLDGTPGPNLPEIDTEDLPEGGFGWALIHALSRDIAYRRAAGQNMLSFAVPRPAGE